MGLSCQRFFLECCCCVNLKKSLAQPSSSLGSKIVAKRVFEGINKESILQTIDMLDIQPGTNVLEIGFGPGISISKMYQKGATVTGLEISDEMIKQASQRCKKGIEEKKVSLLNRNVDNGLKEFEDHTFDIIISSNCIYFWKNLEFVMEELVRILKPGGSFVTIIVSKNEMIENGFNSGPFLNIFDEKEMNELYEKHSLSDTKHTKFKGERMSFIGIKK